MNKPVTPRGINHLVLNVRDMEESHRFWTEIVGFRQVGQLTPQPDRPNPPMRFYSGDKGGETHHHDVALVENRDLPPPPKEWAMFGMPCAVNHIAITMPSREAWLAHLEYLQNKGIKFDRRLEHGMTHSLYIHDPNGYGVEFVYDLPEEIWKDDINGALNWAKALPTEGPEALEDRTEGLPTFRQSAASSSARRAAPGSPTSAVDTAPPPSHRPAGGRTGDGAVIAVRPDRARALSGGSGFCMRHRHRRHYGKKHSCSHVS